MAPPYTALNSTKIDKKNLKVVKKNICKHSPHPNKVNIIAVTKTFSFSAIHSATENKIFNIGENKVQETKKKTTNQTIHQKTKLHLIGHLQNNKVAAAVKIYNVIQSVDNIKTLNKINTCAEKNEKPQKIFLQINISGAQTQKGFNTNEIIKAATLAQQMPFIKNIGIMSIGTHTKNKKTIIKNFMQTKQIQQKIYKTIDFNCSQLSIGMSQDYILALQAGATHIRLGTILFRKRNG